MKDSMPTKQSETSISREVAMDNEIRELRGCLFPCPECKGTGIAKECGDLNCTWICPKCLGFNVERTKAKLLTAHQATQLNDMIDTALDLTGG